MKKKNSNHCLLQSHRRHLWLRHKHSLNWECDQDVLVPKGKCRFLYRIFMKKIKCITKWALFEMTLEKKKQDKNLSVEYTLCHTKKQQPGRRPE